MQPSTDSSNACWSEALQLPTPIADMARKIVNSMKDLEAVKTIFLRYFWFIWNAFRLFEFFHVDLLECRISGYLRLNNNYSSNQTVFIKFNKT
ncbi:MAG: hypothetical protein APR55_02120 [Methanolinea sp. SDB]|nr:MAG: hypothetical protein APR55_02120 [Methanolinea sp. SDB]